MKGILIFLLILIGLSGCKTKEEEKVERAPSKVEILKDIEIEKWRALLNRPIPLIDINKVRNPFISPQLVKALYRGSEEIPLELVGLLIKEGKKYALLQDPTKKGYIVKEGDKIGENVIKSIGENYIIIEENIVDITGFQTKRLKKIVLKREKER